LSITVSELPPATRLIVRGGEIAMAVVGRAFGVLLPQEPCRAATAGDRAALWLGPDEWLLVGPGSEAERLSRGLVQAVGEEPASIVDVSDRQIGIVVEGSAAADALNTFNALDLDRRAFPVGMCTRTLFGKAEIVLWRTASETFRIEVWRSFVPYVLGCLEEATSDPSLASAR
jgi:heterotetrameric sarcosine oxidase gamma subunit